MLSCARSLVMDDLIWRIWLDRNQVVHCLAALDLGDVVRWYTDYLEEWRGAHLLEINGFVQKEVQVHRWRALEQGCWKVNSDATIGLKNRYIGLGIIIRTTDGSVCAVAAYSLKATFLPILAKALAVRHGISLAIELGLVPFLVETDYLQVVQMIRNGDSFNGKVGPIVSDIVDSLKLLPSCSFGFVP
ncbi:hypothetical protein QYF36_025274 [Acer negundo]|nr:hypothetical protein QYF36_025274 [Acer negundo]